MAKKPSDEPLVGAGLVPALDGDHTPQRATTAPPPGGVQAGGPQARVAPTTNYAVRLKPGHPTGVYRRAGITFSASAPTLLDAVPDAVATDPWLIVTGPE